MGLKNLQRSPKISLGGPSQCSVSLTGKKLVQKVLGSVLWPSPFVLSPQGAEMRLPKPLCPPPHTLRSPLNLLSPGWPPPDPKTWKMPQAL